MEEVTNMEAANLVFGVIKTAIEKQIPQKPENLKIDGKYVSRAQCPRCKCDFPDIGGVSEFYGDVEKYEYCPECGQSIDWEGVV